MIDLTLGVCRQAMLVAQLLSLKTDMGARAPVFQTRAWYNGRERGISFEVGDHVGDRLFVVFAINRLENGIFVDSWIAGPTFNGPNVHIDAVRREQALDNRKTYGRDELIECADFIYDLVQDWVTARVVSTTNRSGLVSKVK